MKTSNPSKVCNVSIFSDQTLMVGEGVGGGLKIEKKIPKRSRVGGGLNISLGKA